MVSHARARCDVSGGPASLDTRVVSPLQQHEPFTHRVGIRGDAGSLALPARRAHWRRRYREQRRKDPARRRIDRRHRGIAVVQIELIRSVDQPEPRHEQRRGAQGSESRPSPARPAARQGAQRDRQRGADEDPVIGPDAREDVDACREPEHRWRDRRSDTRQGACSPMRRSSERIPSSVTAAAHANTMSFRICVPLRSRSGAPEIASERHGDGQIGRARRSGRPIARHAR